MTTRIVIFLMTFIFISCEKKNPEIKSINGVWQSIGSGWLLEIQDSSSYSFFDITPISCLPARKSDLGEIIASLALKNDTLSCTTSIPAEKKNDALYNFEVFAKTVGKHYAFMQLNNIDWPKLYAQQKGKLINNTSNVALYQIIEETLELLNDNHAYLEATDDVYEVLDEMESVAEEETLDNELPEYGDFEIANMVTKHHFTENLTTDSWLINWGKMGNDRGYILVKAMWLFADLNISEALIEEMGYVDAYVKTFHEMNEAFAISSLSIPHLKRIGAPTQGALSTALEKKLPNGWVFSISNEIYIDNAGNSYENIGVPVDYDLNYPRDSQTFFRAVANDLDGDQQNILKAISVLE